VITGRNAQTKGTFLNGINRDRGTGDSGIITNGYISIFTQRCRIRWRHTNIIYELIGRLCRGNKNIEQYKGKNNYYPFHFFEIVVRGLVGND
jgi:hypothetical protein